MYSRVVGLNGILPYEGTPCFVIIPSHRLLALIRVIGGILVCGLLMFLILFLIGIYPLISIPDIGGVVFNILFMCWMSLISWVLEVSLALNCLVSVLLTRMSLVSRVLEFTFILNFRISVSILYSIPFSILFNYGRLIFLLNHIGTIYIEVFSLYLVNITATFDNCLFVYIPINQIYLFNPFSCSPLDKVHVGAPVYNPVILNSYVVYVFRVIYDCNVSGSWNNYVMDAGAQEKA